MNTNSVVALTLNNEFDQDAFHHFDNKFSISIINSLRCEVNLMALLGKMPMPTPKRGWWGGILQGGPGPSICEKKGYTLIRWCTRVFSFLLLAFEHFFQFLLAELSHRGWVDPLRYVGEGKLPKRSSVALSSETNGHWFTGPPVKI